MAIEHETPVLVVGGGPAGLIAALQLARQGIRCMLTERNPDTTKWPKMDITNCRSMELLRRLGVADSLRAIGVPQNYSFDVLFSNGLSDGGELIAKWDLPSPEEWRTRIKQQNDGSMPREPYQRCSQAIFEAWLKPRIQAEPLVTSFFGMKFETLVETDDCVESQLIDSAGETHVIRSKYVIGCDGAGSRVRRAIGGNLIGGPVPGAMYLVHFKSRDLTRLHRQGQFWHIFFSHGCVIISQDEVDTWTTHMPIGLDTDISTLDPVQVVYSVLGGCLDPFPIEIDQILVTSSWRPNICVVDKYASPKGRIFLSGDAAHQNIPTGGYGMNTALADSFDIGWKVGAVLAGYGGPALLQSYETERRPVAARNIEHSGVHWTVHTTVWEWSAKGPIVSQAEDGKQLRTRIADFLLQHDGENKDQGIELGYRYTGSPVIVADNGEEPVWTKSHYVPTTWPGARAPHVFLKDGKTSIFDLFGTGREYSLVDFTHDGTYIRRFESAIKSLNIPVKTIHLPDEEHARLVWERDAVLIRPDDHVAWRAKLGSTEKDVNSLDVENVLLVSVGQRESHHGKGDIDAERVASLPEEKAFTGTVGNVDQEKVERLAAFQKSHAILVGRMRIATLLALVVGAARLKGVLIDKPKRKHFCKSVYHRATNGDAVEIGKFSLRHRMRARDPRFLSPLFGWSTKTSVRSRRPLSFNDSVRRRSNGSDKRKTPDFAFAFDIDGVLLRSSAAIPGASECLSFLQKERIPFILLTNGGGKHESDRVAELSEKLSVPLDTSMFVQSHTPFSELVHSVDGKPGLKDKCIMVVGGDYGKCRDVAERYGFRKVITPGDIFASYPEIWPFSRVYAEYYKSFARPLPRPINKDDPGNSLRIDAIFVFNDPRDWALDIQILLDALLSREGIMGTYSEKNNDRSLPNNGYQQDGQPSLYFSNPDLFWAAGYHLSRLGQGGFREALEGVWAAVTGGPREGAYLQKILIGKPFKETYEFAERRLMHRQQRLFAKGPGLQVPLKRVYMVGDNPESDIRGANTYQSQHGTEWISLLTRTGVYKDGAGNVPSWQPREIVDDVSAAVKWALQDSKWPES